MKRLSIKKLEDIKEKNKKVLGVSILEALVSTVIIGIGFVAILQMTNYSVQSEYLNCYSRLCSVESLPIS